MIENIQSDKILIYKNLGKTSLKLHVFTPPGHLTQDKRAAIVFFFGGGWINGTPTQFYPHCRHLASMGMVAISAEYRVNERHNTTPVEAVQDGKSAIRWIRAQGSALGIDPDRIAAGGGSAGGQIAAATATAHSLDDKQTSFRPNALVLFNPVIDNGPGGYGHDRVKEHWESLSPLHNITEGIPPTIVFLGTRDELVPVETATEFKKQMEAHGNRCDLHLYKEQGHGFFNYANRDNYDKTILKMDHFLASLGYLETTK